MKHDALTCWFAGVLVEDFCVFSGDLGQQFPSPLCHYRLWYQSDTSLMKWVSDWSLLFSFFWKCLRMIGIISLFGGIDWWSHLTLGLFRVGAQRPALNHRFQHLDKNWHLWPHPGLRCQAPSCSGETGAASAPRLSPPPSPDCWLALLLLAQGPLGDTVKNSSVDCQYSSRKCTSGSSQAPDPAA